LYSILDELLGENEVIPAEAGIPPSPSNEQYTPPLMSLPDLTPVLLHAVEEDELELNESKFVRLHRDHLLSITSKPSRGDHNMFCQMVIEKYPAMSRPVDYKFRQPWVFQ